MKDLTKFYSRPRLRAPNMLAAWPGISNVSTIIAQYLQAQLEFKELGEIVASNFFDPIGVLAKDSLVEAPQFPQNKFYYLKNKGGENDLILFTGDDQPPTKSYELANCVVDVALKYHVTRIYTCAAALTRIHHTEQPRVWGVATRPDMVPELEKNELRQKGNLHISGLNGILMGVAKERDMEGICLLGEVPMYVTRMPNPIAALAITRVLVTMLDINVDLTELTRQAIETGEKLKQIAAEAMGEYIDYFTTPIWESGQEEEEEEE
ncbi:PAC2 family protein [Chloroflexota bacterium]